MSHQRTIDALQQAQKNQVEQQRLLAALTVHPTRDIFEKLRALSKDTTHQLEIMTSDDQLH
jgi:hypothetical protein